jgi:hypothetical protein
MLKKPTMMIETSAWLEMVWLKFSMASVNQSISMIEEVLMIPSQTMATQTSTKKTFQWM